MVDLKNLEENESAFCKLNVLVSLVISTYLNIGWLGYLLSGARNHGLCNIFRFFNQSKCEHRNLCEESPGDQSLLLKPSPSKISERSDSANRFSSPGFRAKKYVASFFFLIALILRYLLSKSKIAIFFSFLRIFELLLSYLRKEGVKNYFEATYFSSTS